MSDDFNKMVKANSNILKLERIYGVTIVHITDVNNFVTKFNYEDFYKHCYANNVIYLKIVSYASQLSVDAIYYQKLILVPKKMYPYQAFALQVLTSNVDLYNDIKAERIEKLKSIL
jgi:hypothetical protein